MQASDLSGSRAIMLMNSIQRTYHKRTHSGCTLFRDALYQASGGYAAQRFTAVKSSDQHT